MENQLKATGLRIGNFINDNDNFTMQVVGLFKDEVLLDFDGNQGDFFVYTGKELELLKPIHLTEDILVKLGFEIDSVDRPILHADYKVINPITHDYMIELKNVGTGWFYRNGYFKIDYVHQLQNLYFALCGEELTFKN